MQSVDKLPIQKLPNHLKRGIVDTEKTRAVRTILKEKCLNTVCEEARCPNKAECYSKNSATFMILGVVCTRNCRFCNINDEKSLAPQTPNPQESENIAQAVHELGLNYVTITSVTRDDLADGGTNHFASTIRAIKKYNPITKVEVLTPDFQGEKHLIDIVLEAAPDVFNHNIETVEALYEKVRPMANYRRSLDFLEYIKKKSPQTFTKTGLMVGLGETKDQLIKTLEDIHVAHVDIVTIGQYMQPSKKHLAVSRYYEVPEFEELEDIAKKIGIKKTFFSPLVRSSYKAQEFLH